MTCGKVYLLVRIFMKWLALLRIEEWMKDTHAYIQFSVRNLFAQRFEQAFLLFAHRSLVGLPSIAAGARQFFSGLSLHLRSDRNCFHQMGEGRPRLIHMEAPRGTLITLLLSLIANKTNSNEHGDENGHHRIGGG